MRGVNRRQVAFLVVVSLLVAGLVTALLVQSPPEPRGRMRVLATFYPLYYFASEIGGDRAAVESLIPFNSEPHSWEPTPRDIVRADKARLFIYNGAGLEPWVEDLLSSLHNRASLVVVDTSIGLNFTEEHGGEEKENEHHHDTDPHIWLDPMLASHQVDRILEGYIVVDPEGEAYYLERAGGLKARLRALHTEFEEGLKNRTKNLIVTTHEGFGHLARRYGFEVEAVLGLSPDEQPSAAQMAEVVELARANNLSVVFGEPVYDDQYIRTIAAEVSRQVGWEVRVLLLDGIHGRAGPHAGMDYFEIMRENLKALREGLEVQ